MELDLRDKGLELKLGVDRRDLLLGSLGVADESSKMKAKVIDNHVFTD